MSRNTALDALLALGTAIVLPSGAWGETGRRVKSPDQCQMPALFQADTETQTHSALGQIVRRKIAVTWVIYHSAGADQSIAPSVFGADLVDALEAKLAAPVNLLSLTGAVYAAFIDGAIRRFPGDLDGVEIITVPITLLLP